MKTDRKKMTYQDHLKSKLKDSEFRKYYLQEGLKLQIGYKIFELRTKHGLTQAQLARKIGTTQSTIARLESADTDNYEIQTLERIAEVLGRKLVVEFAKAA